MFSFVKYVHRLSGENIISVIYIFLTRKREYSRNKLYYRYWSIYAISSCCIAHRASEPVLSSCLNQTNYIIGTGPDKLFPHVTEQSIMSETMM